MGNALTPAKREWTAPLQWATLQPMVDETLHLSNHQTIRVTSQTPDELEVEAVGRSG